MYLRHQVNQIPRYRDTWNNKGMITKLILLVSTLSYPP